MGYRMAEGKRGCFEKPGNRRALSLALMSPHIGSGPLKDGMAAPRYRPERPMRANCRWSLVTILTSSLASLLLSGPASGAQGTPTSSRGARIVVGPEIPVSSDGDVPHVELMVAAHPRDARRLIGAAITGTKRFGGMADKLYVSSDGGYAWTDVDLPEQRIFGSGDPQVAFGAAGTAYFTSLTNKFDTASKRDRVGLFVYRSNDGGLEWGAPIDLGFGYDHEQIVVDHTGGPLAGRVYIGALYGYPVYRVGIFRSTDDGRSFVGPVEVANGKGEYGINVVNLLVLSDGTLFVPFADFEFKPDQRKTNPHSNFWFATSRDGGETFTPAKKFFQQFRGNRDSLGLTTFPVFAVDTSTTYRDRLYLVWTDFRSGRARLLFSMSTDRGERWSDPRLIDPSVPATADQYQPAMAVSNDGTLAISWFDSRGTTGGHHYHEYFTASVDGGATFLPPRRVSTAVSSALGAGNLALYSSEFRYPADSLRVALLSAANRWASGGDYMGLTADADGVFHPWWADSRTGTFQIYTARVRVDRAGANVALAGRSPDSKWSRGAVTSSVHLVFGLASYDSITHTFALPVRLRNDDARAIRGPIVVEIGGFGNGLVGENADRGHAPSIVNAANGKQGDGATFEYAAGGALGDEGVLEPGAQTASVVWRLRARDPLRLPNMHVTITGYVTR